MQRCRLGVRVPVQHLLDDIADVAVAHVRLAERVPVDPGQVSHTALRMTAYPKIQLALIAVGERSRREETPPPPAAGCSSSRVAKYSPSSRVFSSLLRVARIASPVRARQRLHLYWIWLAGGGVDGLAGVVVVEGPG